MDLARPEPFRGDRDRYRSDRRDRYSGPQVEAASSEIKEKVESAAPVNELPKSDTENAEQGEEIRLTEGEVRGDGSAVDDIPVVAEAPQEQMEKMPEFESPEATTDEGSAQSQEQVAVSKPAKRRSTKA